MRLLIVTIVSHLLLSGSITASEHNDAPEGFVALFNGEDLSGWRGLGHADPRKLAALSEEQRAARHARDMENLRAHWRVENGEIVNDGHGVFLTTNRDYGDFELHVDWRMMNPNTDSGIYLRGCPQVQIWDIANIRENKNGNEKGSGGLWNNNAGSPGRFPTEVADNPVGEWNTFRIRMVGSRVSVTFNGKLVVDHAIMHNYFDRKRPMFRSGPIQLQTHGGEMRFRNIFLREIPASEASSILRSHGSAGFVPLFNGKDLSGWAGPLDNYEVVDGTLQCKPHKGGTIYTKSEFSDFRVRLEIKLPPGGNNGLAIRYPGKGDTAYVGMCELQVLDDDADRFKSLDPRQYHGSAYGMVAAHRGFMRPAGEWNFQEVTVRGSSIVVEVNGTVILNCDLSQVSEYMGGRPHAGKDRVRGHFGFAGHHDPVQFRNVAIKSLDTE